MPYYQCPRCGGNNSFGQWEQRFNNQNITYRDNQNRQVGSSNGGFGVSNVRQQYCSSCVSVKMDMKFTQSEIKFVAYGIIGFVVVTTVLSLGSVMISNAKDFFSNIDSRAINDSFQQLGTVFYGISGTIFLIGMASILLYRKLWIRKQDQLFLKDRFHKPRAPKSFKFLSGWFFFLYVLTNAIYISQL
jgi:hypothetical protein